MAANVEELRKEIAEFREEVEERFDTLGKRSAGDFERIEARLTSLEVKAGALKENP